MRSTQRNLIERAVELGASAVLGAAVAASVWIATASLAAVPAGVAAFAAGWSLLRRFAVEASAPGFAAAPFAFDAEETLLLDDVLVAPQPDSRVVRLFAGDRVAPGELARRIDRFLENGQAPAPAPPEEAAQALYEALAEIRRSLRR